MATLHFDRGSDTTVGGGNASGLIPGASLSFAQSVTDDLKLGFWRGSYFGGALQYNDGWSGRYYGTKPEILTLGAGINGTHKITDWLSIGGAQKARRKLQNAAAGSLAVWFGPSEACLMRRADA